LINRLPSVILKNISPYELLYKLPTYLDFKFFGSLCFAYSLENNQTNLEPRYRKCAFIGYKYGIKGYALLDTKNIEIPIRRNVIFYDKKKALDYDNNHVQYFAYHLDSIFEPLDNISYIDNTSHVLRHLKRNWNAYKLFHTPLMSTNKILFEVWTNYVILILLGESLGTLISHQH